MLKDVKKNFSSFFPHIVDEEKILEYDKIKFAPLVDENEPMAEGARWKHWNSDKGKIAACRSGNVFRTRQLRDIELIPAQHAIKYLTRCVDLVEVELDPLGSDDAPQYRLHPVVAAAAKA